MLVVTDLVKVIRGARAVVLWDRDFDADTLAEAELAFHAQDNSGNVWVLGEYPEQYSGGVFAGAPNTWISGVAGGEGGIIVEGNPRVGDKFLQGSVPDIAFLDCARVLKMGETTCVPTGCYGDVQVVAERSPLEPGSGTQLKYYAPGVGNVQIGAVGDKENETLVLVEVARLGAQRPPASMNRARLSVAVRSSGVSRPYEWMSSVDTMRIRFAIDCRSSSEMGSDHGQWANSSTPAPRALTTCPRPWTCAVTMVPAWWATSQTARSSSSDSVGPASALSATFNTAAPRSRTLVIAAFAAVYLIWGSTYLGIHFAVESLPPAVQATVREQTKGAVIHNISKEVEHGKTLYEVETKVGGRSRDMIIGADGKLMVVEAQVVMDSLPAPARETYMKHIGKGKIVALETVSLGGSLAYYEAQIEANGKRSELKVDPNGNVVTDKKKK